MKVEDRELDKLVEELDTEGNGKINYKEFLKYSYLSAMYIQHGNLKLQLEQADEGKKGLITVAQLE